MAIEEQSKAPNKIIVSEYDYGLNITWHKRASEDAIKDHEYLRKDFVIQYLESVIEPQQQIVDMYVQEKSYEGGKLRAYKEILEDIKRM